MSHSSANYYPTEVNTRNPVRKPISCLGIFYPVLIGSVVFLFAALIYVYFYVNYDLFGIGAPDFKNWVIDSNFENVQARDGAWKIQYETGKLVTFTGLVRHVSPIRLFGFPLLTHDILVTSGDFADAQKVGTRVSNHHFFWSSSSQTKPDGTINLLHTVPQTDGIYRQLLHVQSGQQVRISGYEILKIEAYNKEGKLMGAWADTGCNSTLITSVVLTNPE